MLLDTITENRKTYDLKQLEKIRMYSKIIKENSEEITIDDFNIYENKGYINDFLKDKEIPEILWPIIKYISNITDDNIKNKKIYIPDITILERYNLI